MDFTTPIPGAETRFTSPAQWLAAAQAEVRKHCGWHIAPVITETIRIDGNGSTRLLVPSMRILRLLSVKNDGVDVTEQVRWSEKGVLQLPSRWSADEGAVTLEYEHGYEEAPDVAAVIQAIARRSGEIIRSQAVGPASVGYAVAEMLQRERDALAPYRL